ncbi:hypothetical protein BOX15_Mlig001265g14 [Macrostomum lignano]|uniref:Reverse transcriptase n=1 Tax=Macrostomum lignano TaxID=282301 RepID=A0A267FMA7_9PLAT|nr:hypothetical protein BOX15_Mlig001265g14 [Macrostomum lignano]
MDMQSGYWQMAVEPSDRLKTAFGVSHRVQQYAWNVMPFGLTNAPASFSRLMNVVLGKLCWKTCLVYLDDLLVWSRTVEEHLERLQTVFRRLRAANIKLKPKKCAFLLKSVTFLGHVVSADGIATSPEKIAEIRDWPTPRNVKEVRSFLGLCGYYRQFIADFSRIAEPMLRRTRHDCPWSWDEECQAAFEALKERLQGSEVMAFPNFAEDAGEFVLDTDGSTKEGIGAVLSQVQKDGSEKVIAYGSRTLSREERNYCTTRVELLAVVFFVQKFRYYLMGREFLVRTDHSSLKWLHSLRDVEGQLARWLELLAPYRYRIEHRPGVKHQHADALSRKPRRRHQGSESCPGCAQEQIGVNALGLQKWTSEEIRESQKMDSDIRQAMELLAHSDGEITEEHLRRISPTARRIVERRRDLEVSDSEVLLCHTASRRQPQVVLPRNMLRAVLEEAHGGRSGGHVGIFKTKEKVRQSFWRPGLGREVEEHVKACLDCTKAKAGKKPIAPMEPIPSSSPFDIVMTDVIGPLPRSKKGNFYILTVQDAFSKWPDAYAIRNQKAATIARVLFERWIANHGCPRVLHSDQGRNFESGIVRKLCELLGVKKTRTSAYHPSGNGQVERFNGFLKNSLRTYLVQKGQNAWEEYLPSALMAYRSTVQASTGYTPYYMLHGQEMPLGFEPEDLRRKTDSCPLFVQEIKQNLLHAHERIREGRETVQRRQKMNYDRKVKGKAIQKGDSVLLYYPCLEMGEKSKFHINWRGPVKVLEKLSDALYRVQDPTQPQKTKVVHFNNLRPVQVQTEAADGQETREEIGRASSGKTRPRRDNSAAGRSRRQRVQRGETQRWTAARGPQDQESEQEDEEFEDLQLRFQDPRDHAPPDTRNLAEDCEPGPERREADDDEEEHDDESRYDEEQDEEDEAEPNDANVPEQEVRTAQEEAGRPRRLRRPPDRFGVPVYYY